MWGDNKQLQHTSTYTNYIPIHLMCLNEWICMCAPARSPARNAIFFWLPFFVSVMFSPETLDFSIHAEYFTVDFKWRVYSVADWEMIWVKCYGLMRLTVTAHRLAADQFSRLAALQFQSFLCHPFWPATVSFILWVGFKQYFDGKLCPCQWRANRSRTSKYVGIF